MKTAGKEPFPVIYVDGKEDGKVNFFSTLAMSKNVRYFLYQNQRLMLGAHLPTDADETV